MSKEVLLDVRHLTQQFHLTKEIKVKAVDDVSFQIHKGEIFGLVGESGSGKSTVARCLMNIYQPAQGEIWYKGVNICDKKEFKKHKKMLRLGFSGKSRLSHAVKQVKRRKIQNAVRTFQKCIGDAVGKKGFPDAGAAVKK